jgi:16S rRNA (uracil1498-N3)-methyltransferase
VRRVLRCSVGDPLVLFDPTGGLEAAATIAAITGSDVLCEVELPRAPSRRGFTGLSLCVALSKGEKPEELLRAAVALGVGRVTFVESERSVVRATGRELRKAERWHKVVLDAARQCLRGDLPEIVGPFSWAECVARLRPVSVEAGPLAPGISVQRLVLHTSPACRPLLSLLEAGNASSVELWLGPEGGFSDAEIVQLEALGAHPTSLGPLVQRAELAAVSAAAVAAAWGLSRGVWGDPPDLLGPP